MGLIAGRLVSRVVFHRVSRAQVEEGEMSERSSEEKKGFGRSGAAMGVLLLVLGVLLATEALGVLRLGEIFWAVAATGAAVMLAAFWVRDRTQWWAFIPAGALVGIAVVLLAPHWSVFAGIDGDRIGPAFLLCLGLGFGLVYAVNRAQWWALIPMGSLWTVATVALLESTNTAVGEPGVASVMFFGMAATFMLVAIAPGGRERIRRWALIPAGALILIGVLVAGSFTSILNLIVPLALMAVGLGLLLGFFFRRK
jgi:hypothetical protein